MISDLISSPVLCIIQESTRGPSCADAEGLLPHLPGPSLAALGQCLRRRFLLPANKRRLSALRRPEEAYGSLLAIPENRAERALRVPKA